MGSAHQPAATLPGKILWGVRAMAPAVPPGTYTVRLAMGVATETCPGGGEAALLDHRRDGRGPVITIRDVKAQLQERLAAAGR